MAYAVQGNFYAYGWYWWHGNKQFSKRTYGRKLYTSAANANRAAKQIARRHSMPLQVMALPLTSR